MLCLATVVTIVEAPFFGILCIRRILQSVGIPKRFQTLAKRSARTKDAVVAPTFDFTMLRLWSSVPDSVKEASIPLTICFFNQLIK